MCEYTAKDYKKDNPVGVRVVVTTSFWLHCTKQWQKSAKLLGRMPSSRYRLLQPSALLHEYVCDADHPRTCCCHLYRCQGCQSQPTVWQISGDGDGLAIGGNHFIHAVRRNIDSNMILLNNRIYGLTKGQYSPTSPRGFVSKSSPYGTVEDPFHPAELCFGARGRFFARAVATDAPGTVEILKAAMAHKGASVCEILQNCVIFNNGTHDSVAKKEDRAKNAIYLKHGEPMLFGENNEYGLMQEGFGLKVVKLGENGITEKDILIHDAHCMDNTLQLKLAPMEGPDFPIALGVIRDVEAPTYDDAVHEQIEEVSAKKKYHNFEELLMTNDTWEVK